MDLSETDLEEIRGNIRNLCSRFPDAYWRDKDRDRTYPAEFVQAFAAAGYMAASLQEADGGSGLGMRPICAMLEAVHHAGCEASACRAQIAALAWLLPAGDSAAESDWLPGLTDGSVRLHAMAAGSGDAVAARQDGDGYRLDGVLARVERAAETDLLLLRANTDADALLLLIDLRGSGEGLAITPVRTMTNHATAKVTFDDYSVPATALVCEERQAELRREAAGTVERLLAAAQCLGDARWCLDRALAYSSERVVFGRPIGANHGIQDPIVAALAETEAAAALIDRAARAYEDSHHGGDRAARTAAIALLRAQSAAWQAADMCLQTHGGFGFATEYDVERKFREARRHRLVPVPAARLVRELASTMDLPA